jgi:5'-3' exoribonuclease 2
LEQKNRLRDELALKGIVNPDIDSYI